MMGKEYKAQATQHTGTLCFSNAKQKLKIVVTMTYALFGCSTKCGGCGNCREREKSSPQFGFEGI